MLVLFLILFFSFRGSSLYSRVAADHNRPPVLSHSRQVVNVLAGIGDLNAVDKMGRSALSFARSMGRTEAERILLAHGARPAPVAAVNGSTYQ